MTDRTDPNSGPLPELAEPYSPPLGLGEFLGRLVHTWKGTTYPGPGSDADGLDNPQRRDETGQPPTAVTAPDGPLTAADMAPAMSEPLVLVIELAKPVDVVRPGSWSPATITVTTDPVRAIGANPRRRGAVVTNRGSVDIRLAAGREGLSGSSAYATLQGGEARTFDHTAEVWAVTGSGTADLEIVTELA